MKTVSWPGELPASTTSPSADRSEEQLRAAADSRPTPETLYGQAFAELALGDYTALCFSTRRAANLALELLQKQPIEEPFHREAALNALLLLHKAAKAGEVMDQINNTDERTAKHAGPTNGFANTKGQWLLPGACGVQQKISPRVKALAGWIAMCALLFSPCVPAHGGLLKPDIGFWNYDVPLFDQVVNRIKAKIAARLGEGENKQDRYFIIPFAYQDKINNPQFSHSFISVIRVLADRKQPSLTPGLRQGKFKNRNFEAFTISWLPHDFDTNPHLCVFDGLGSRVDPKLNQCPNSVGRDFRLDETLKLGVNVKNAIGMWGPYEIKKEAFDLAVNRKRLLDGGTIGYRADDRLTRKDRVAINCFHAMAGLEELYPNGGFLGTGFRVWGINGTARVLIEYTKKVRNKHLLLEPVDIKKDLYGFVYAPERNSRGLYNPFPNASAYHQ